MAKPRNLRKGAMLVLRRKVGCWCWALQELRWVKRASVDSDKGPVADNIPRRDLQFEMAVFGHWQHSCMRFQGSDGSF